MLNSLRFWKTFGTYLIAPLAAIWLLLEPASYFMGDRLRIILGDYWWLVYLVPLLIAFFGAYLDNTPEGASRLRKWLARFWHFLLLAMLLISLEISLYTSYGDWRIVVFSAAHITVIGWIAWILITRKTLRRELGTIGQVRLTKLHIDPKNPKWMRAFVRTDGQSNNILATFSERKKDPLADCIYAGPRTYKNQLGIMVTVFLRIHKSRDGDDDPRNLLKTVPDDFEVQVVLFQPDAQIFAPPVFYPDL
jgi:hypothetical protein